MKIAVVGMGSIGRRHFSNLLAIGGHELVAVSEHNRLAQITIGNQQIVTVNDFGTVLNDDTVDAVVIANPTSLHLEYALRAVGAGKHVYLEKPAAASVNGVEALVRLASERKRIVAMGTQYRFNDGIGNLRDALGRGEAGMLLSVEAHLGEHIADYHPDEDYRTGYAARRDLGGGVLLTQIHQIDYLNWLFGPFDLAFAVGGRRSDLEIDVEDCVSYLLRARNGLPVFGHLNYLERPKRVAMRVTGTSGCFDWNYFENTLAFTAATLDAETRVERRDFDRNEMFLATMKDFLNAVATGTRPRATVQDGLDALRIVDALREAFSSGNSVRIPN